MADAERLSYLSCTLYPQTLLGVFAKHWQPGLAKSRLAKAVGDECAAQIARAMLATTLARFQDAAQAQVIGFMPASEEPAFRVLARSQWGVWPQPDGDLGVRMTEFFELASLDAPRVVLIGSDSPDLPLNILEAAFEQLQSHRIVLGPAVDGGYYLLGIAGPPPPIFEGIAWGMASVCEQTVEHLRGLGCDYFLLPQWHDVDDEAGMSALLGRLADGGAGDVHLARLRDRLKGLLSDSGTV
jgi:rSAM/selenodomain-associated transferase 1